MNSETLALYKRFVDNSWDAMTLARELLIPFFNKDFKFSRFMGDVVADVEYKGGTLTIVVMTESEVEIDLTVKGTPYFILSSLGTIHLNMLVRHFEEMENG